MEIGEGGTFAWAALLSATKNNQCSRTLSYLPSSTRQFSSARGGMDRMASR